ncbi:MAG: endonuclease Q family protein [candidate division WOR-3 bacterium]
MTGFYIADLHIHSSYSRATAKGMTPRLLAETAKQKGISLLGTGDIFHPDWREELERELEEKGRGIYHLEGVDFILTGELSFIYPKRGSVRKVHILYALPSFRDVEKLVRGMGQYNLTSDGRPILGEDAAEFTKFILDHVPDAMVIPAHIWTPWFSVFGSNSGFNSLQEAFGPLVDSITALETGLSSDPPMNWRVSELDRFSLVSNSDAHSPDRIGREANVFSGPLDYFQLKEALEKKDRSRFLFTIEFYPEEGKYHYDGHRVCKVVFHPRETKKHNGICPVCGKPVTVGVLHRVEELADRPEGEKPPSAIDYRSLIPLREIIGDVLGTSPSSKSVDNIYSKLISGLGSEMNVLLNASLEDIAKFSDSTIAKGVAAARRGDVDIIPGHDGEYGKISLRLKKEGMGSLF